MKLVLALTAVVIALFMGGPLATTVQAQDVNNFVISNYIIDYELDRDSNDRSMLTTTETITAKFPNYDQNRGIERVIPSTYNNHTTNLVVTSVTDGDGQNRPFSTYTSNGNIVVRIGDPDTYVYGEQTYQITYTQYDVTRFFSDTAVDEFYWDTNGTDWRVPIEQLSVHLSLGEALKDQLSGDQACYVGVSGSSSRCAISNEAGVYSVNAENLSRGENITIAIGFEPNTFSAYEPSVQERAIDLWKKSLFVTGALSVLLIIWLIRRSISLALRTDEIKTIIPEYLPPKNASVTVSAAIYPNAKSVFSAQLLDFAVRHYIKIYETRKKSFFRQAEYELEIIKDVSDLRAEEQELIRDIFLSTEIGTRLNTDSMKKYPSLQHDNMRDNAKKLDTLVKGAYSLRKKDQTSSRKLRRIAWLSLALSLLTLSPFLLIATIIIFIVSFMLTVLTDEGLGLYTYLRGLREYIRVAETERIKMLQAPETAAKVNVSVDPNNPAEVITLYERVLPYAVLFGQEKEWSKALGSYYEAAGQAPEWYSGQSSMFNAAVLTNTISNFKTAATYASPSNSSSGGSSGGGSSGGGGGGGGGGGW